MSKWTAKNTFSPGKTSGTNILLVNMSVIVIECTIRHSIHTYVNITKRPIGV